MLRLARLEQRLLELLLLNIGSRRGNHGLGYRRLRRCYG